MKFVKGKSLKIGAGLAAMVLPALLVWFGSFAIKAIATVPTVYCSYSVVTAPAGCHWATGDILCNPCGGGTTPCPPITIDIPGNPCNGMKLKDSHGGCTPYCIPS